MDRKYLEFGKYRGAEPSTLEAFAEAEWHGEPEFWPEDESFEPLICD